MTDGTAPEPTIEALLQANRDLQTELDDLRKQIQSERETARRMGWFGLRLFVGGDLQRSFRSWIDAKTLRDPLPSTETAALAAALVRRLVRVSLVGLAVAVLPIALLIWQNWEIRQQSGLFRQQIQEQSNQHARTVQQQARQLDQQEQDTLIVRRAQLLATIYDCTEQEKVSETSPRISPHLPQIASSQENCLPKAHPRARAEAVKAFAEIERARNVRANLAQSNLANLALAAADLSGALLSGVDFREAHLPGADLGRTSLHSANLCGAWLYRANLSDADLGDANLCGADLLGADLTGTYLSETDFSGASLRGANLHGAHHLTQAQLDSAQGNEETLLPWGLTHPDHWLEPKPATDSPLDTPR